MKVSVITPTVRPEGLEIVSKALSKQTFQDFEWLVCQKLPEGIDELPVLSKNSDEKSRWVINDDFKGGYWTLNRVYNKLFKHAKGEIIVTWQDWIWANPNAIGQFVDAVEATSGGIVSGVGDQYERTNKWGRPEVKIWSDPRKTEKYGSFYECYPNDIEWNFAAFPREAIFKIGGMDEELDSLGFGGDQLQAGERWDAMGYHSFLDQTNESFTIRHDRSKHGGQDNWDKNHVLFNGKYDKRKAELISEGKWPVLDYLK